MYSSSDHLQWLTKTNEDLHTSDGKAIEVFEFRCNHDETIMSAWAKHFRNHYCSDNEIDVLRSGTPFSRSDYLIHLKFPDPSVAPGPSTRAGDFGEILVADYLEYLLGYWVPRIRYRNKPTRNESTKGSDVLGIHFFRDGESSPQDILTIFEAKAQLSKKEAESLLQKAVNDSKKDFQIRKAETLNYYKEIYLAQKNTAAVERIDQFQSPLDNPYREISGGAALISTRYFDVNQLASTDAHLHPNYSELQLIVIRGENLMDLVHELYQRAADEA